LVYFAKDGFALLFPSEATDVSAQAGDENWDGDEDDEQEVEVEDAGVPGPSPVETCLLAANHAASIASDLNAVLENAGAGMPDMPAVPGEFDDEEIRQQAKRMRLLVFN
jgi:hypothetical protein